MTARFPCRLCEADVQTTVVDLGSTPLANAYLDRSQLDDTEPRYPLHARVCNRCMLVQVEPVVSPEDLFGEYAYFSSYSDTWVEHALRFAERAVADLQLGPTSLVVEIASNDGYLLQHFVRAGVPVLGIEPAGNVAKVAVEAGIPTESRFFGVETASDLVQRGLQADLLVANNVFAHVPDLNDFVAGMRMAMKPDGVVSIEVPHLLRLIEEAQFDTIYHEHFSYFSLLTAEQALLRHNLTVFDVEQVSTHGGSLRIWASRRDAQVPVTARVEEVRQMEKAAGLDLVETYTGFGARVEACRRGVIDFLTSARAEGKVVVAYGAAAKGNTLLNFCGVTTDDIRFVADRSLAKQGRFLPGSHVPIVSPEQIFETRPDYVAILPWNLRDEISSQLIGITEWGGRFVTFVPDVRISS